MGNFLDDVCRPVSQFWGDSVANASGQVDFSPCFEETALVIPPFVFLFLLSLIQFTVPGKTADEAYRKCSMLHVTRTVVTCLVGLTAVIDLCQALYDVSAFGAEGVAVYQYLSPCCRLVDAVLAVALLQWNYKHGIRSSGTLTIFWLLMVVYGSLKFRTYLLIHIYGSTDAVVRSPVLFATATSDLIFFVTLLCVTCIPDKRPTYSQFEANADMSPEFWAPFLSQITFWWMNRIFVTGYKRPLTTDDLWGLMPEEKTSNVSAKFSSEWQKELDKATKGKRSGKSVRTRDIQLLPLNEDADTHDASDVADTSVLLLESSSSQSKLKTPSLLMAIARAFGREFLFEMVLKFIQDILLFVNPLLLKFLIEFTLDKSIPSWHGYVYASLLFVVSEVRSIVLQQYFQRTNKTGFHIRAALMDALYRKSLHLSNSARRKKTVGEIVNLMSVDAQRFFDLMTYFHMLWSSPLQIIVSMLFLWQTLGPSAFGGFAVVILLIPVNSVIVAATRKLQVKQMELKDKRIKILNEVLSGVKVIKLYAWEKSFLSLITDIRHQELKYLRRAAYLNSLSSLVSVSAPVLVSVTAFATYTLSGNDLTPQTAFVSLALFNIVRFPLSMLPSVLSRTVQSYVALKRLSSFLQSEDLDSNAVTRLKLSDSETIISVNNGTFRWEKGQHIILQSINLKVNRASLTGVVGVVGSGKSSLLSALLGEMERDSGQVTMRGSVAYVSQVAWIQNATLKENILFNKDFDEERYIQVIEACALRPDLELLPAGDMTEIGERGINLSGGQKQRVALARAVYSGADVYLLDDPLSAVDTHVGEHLFNHVIGLTGLLRDKVRILVTHGISFLAQFDQIVVLTDGFISEIGTHSELIEQDGAFADFLKTHTAVGNGAEDGQGVEQTHQDLSHQDSTSLGFAKLKETQQTHKQLEQVLGTPNKQEVMANRRGSRIIHTEETEIGMVKRGVFLAFARAIGVFVCLSVVLFYIGLYAFGVGANIWLSSWSDDEAAAAAKNQSLLHSTGFYLAVYTSLSLGQSFMILFAALFVVYGTIRAARLFHRWLLENILRSPMSFFDSTPTGRIINRFSKDMLVIDEQLPDSTRSFFYVFFGIVSMIVVASYTTPIFLSVVIPVAVVFVFAQRFYIATSRQLMRLQSVTRSPIFSHFHETLNGTSTIRAYGQEERFVDDIRDRMDQNLKAHYPYIISLRWLTIRLEFVGICIVFFAALFAVIERDSLSAGLVGLSISYCIRTTQMLTWMVRMMSNLESQIVSVERVKEFSETPTEAPAIIKNRRPPRGWPNEGRLCFNSYSVRYREGLDVVLNEISCSIDSCEKIGIVGRTGAGKSSLTMGLFRILEAAGGSITIDDVDISTIGLEDLRSRITIIPQDPVLFSGTLRNNLDPFDQFSDAKIWSCLASAHLQEHIEGMDNGLSSEVAEGGENLSVGQRQLLCLARALLRKSKILVLDEATAAVDLETDRLIQQTIREAFSDCTVLTIAHRLNTVMDSDRVMVLDNGCILEFDSPAVLLSAGGVFRSMASSAGLV